MLRIRYGNRDLFGQPFADLVFHFLELADGQAAADLGALAGGVGVLLHQIAGEELDEIGDSPLK